MTINIKNINTNIIHKNNNFITLTLKIKKPHNKKSLFFISIIKLHNLLITLKNHLHQKHKLNTTTHLQYKQTHNKIIKKITKNIPKILINKLKNTNINHQINTLKLTNNQNKNLTFILTLHNNNKYKLIINKLQIKILTQTIIHTINNTKIHKLTLHITSLLNFLPLYNINYQNNNNLKYNTYSQPK